MGDGWVKAGGVVDTDPLCAGCDDHTGECVDVCSSSQLGVCQCSEGFTLSNHGNYCEGGLDTE